MEDRISVDLIVQVLDERVAANLLCQGMRVWAVDLQDPARVIYVLTHEDLLAGPEADPRHPETVTTDEFCRALSELKRAVLQARASRK